MQENVSNFPYYEETPKGWRVRLSKGASLPGMFTSILMAERAYNKHLALKKQQKATKTKDK